MIYKIRCALAKLMYGRNGMDQLNRACGWGVVIVLVVSMLLQNRIPVISTALYLVGLVLWVLMFFRMFSKNLAKRREENQKYVNWIWKRKKLAEDAKARKADTAHKYFTCRCGAVCRVPVGKGKVVITCPKCGAQIKGKT